MTSIDQPPLLTLAEELTSIALIETGTVNPFFLLARKELAYHIEVDFSTEQQKQFTTVKIAAILQAKQCDHYSFATRIQFPAQAGETKVMKQQVLILFASKINATDYRCFANLYDMKLNAKLGRPQLIKQQTLEDFDGQFSNLFDAPTIDDELSQQLVANADEYLYSPTSN